jgi:hypothetical protein
MKSCSQARLPSGISRSLGYHYLATGYYPDGKYAAAQQGHSEKRSAISFVYRHAARPSMPQDAGFVNAQCRHSAIGQLYLHKATFGKRQRTHGLGWKGEMTSKACVYDDLNVGAVALGVRTHDL